MATLSYLGLWKFLPGVVNNVTYTSVATNSTPIVLTLSSVVTTPERRNEKAESFGKYIQRRTTFKIPVEVWTAPIVTTVALTISYFARVNRFVTYTAGIPIGSILSIPALGASNLLVTNVADTGGGDGSWYVYFSPSFSVMPRDTNVAATWTLTTAAPNIYPKPRDTLLSGGVLWQVSDATDVTHNGGLYRLECNFFERNFQLEDTIAFFNALCATSTATGDRVVVDQGVVTMAASIQPIRQEAQEDHFGAKTSPEYFDVYLTLDVSAANDPSIVQAGAIIQDQNGVQYDVLQVDNRESLNMETHLLAVKKL